MQTIRSLLTINERNFELLLNVTLCAFYSTELPDFFTICPSYENFRKISDLLNFRNANRSTCNSGNSDKKLKFNGYSGEKISKILRVVYQGSKFIFGFGSNCATRCKFLGALPKFLAQS